MENPSCSWGCSPGRAFLSSYFSVWRTDMSIEDSKNDPLTGLPTDPGELLRQLGPTDFEAVECVGQLADDRAQRARTAVFAAVNHARQEALRGQVAGIVALPRETPWHPL